MHRDFGLLATTYRLLSGVESNIDHIPIRRSTDRSLSFQHTRITILPRATSPTQAAVGTVESSEKPRDNFTSEIKAHAIKHLFLEVGPLI